MALFRRRQQAQQTDPIENRQPGDAPDSRASDSDGADESGTHNSGPRDSAGSPAPSGYVDLGALYVPRIPGLQLQGKFDPGKSTLNNILLVLGSSGITVSVAAAPKSPGSWEVLVGQIAQAIANAGGTTELTEGPFGTELRAKISASLPDGTKGLAPLRVIGLDGPRWVLRIDVQGAAAAGDQKAAEACEDLIRRLIVNRGSEPRIRFEVLPLTLPKDAVSTDGS